MESVTVLVEVITLTLEAFSCYEFMVPTYHCHFKLMEKKRFLLSNFTR